MDFGDLLLTPVYILLLYLIFRVFRNRYDDPLLKKYHRQAFWVKMIGCIAFILYSVYLSPGDSINLYHQEGHHLFRQILKDPQNIQYLFMPGSEYNLNMVKDPGNVGYFASEANFMVIRLDTIFSFVSFGKFAPVNFIFASIAFSGIWKLFLFFYEQYPHLHKQFAIAILFLPSLVFWSGGLLKDTLSIASLGWITYTFYELFFKKNKSLKNIFLLAVFTYLLAVIKVYILLAYLPFFILFIFLKKVQGIKNTFFKAMLAPSMILICVFSFSRITGELDQELGVYAVKEVAESISTLNAGFAQKNGQEDAASNFNLGADFEPSFQGLIKIAPYAVAATFFRPFLWETTKVSQLMAALESLVLMFFTLFIFIKAGIFRLAWLVLTDPLIMYCFLFSIVFGLFVGASTINFGTLVRYKIPCLPFYTIAMFLVYERVKERAAKKILQRQIESAGQHVSRPAYIP